MIIPPRRRWKGWDEVLFVRKTPDPPHKSLTPDTKTRSDIKIVPSFHDEKRFPQVHLPPWTEASGIIDELEYSEDIIKFVLSFNKRVAFHIPRQKIVSGPLLLQPNEFVSILRTDIGYNIQTHAHDQEHRASDDSSKPWAVDDIKPSLRRADSE